MTKGARPERHSLYRARWTATSGAARRTALGMGLLLALATGLAGQSGELGGDWRLNYDLSDDPRGHPPTADGERHPRRPRDRFGFQPPYDEFGRRHGFHRRPYLPEDRDEEPIPADEVREAFADLLTAPRRMTIEQRARDILLRYDDGRVVRLVADDRDHAGSRDGACGSHARRAGMAPRSGRRSACSPFPGSPTCSRPISTGSAWW